MTTSWNIIRQVTVSTAIALLMLLPACGGSGGGSGSSSGGGSTGSSVTLSWTAPTTNTDDSTCNDIDGYRLYYGTTSGAYTVVADVGNNTSAVISSLTSGTTYYFAVTAYDTSGNESGFSNEVQKTL